MRRIGSYVASTVPSFAALAAASTPARQAVLLPLVPTVGRAGIAYDAAVPNLHVLSPIGVTPQEKKDLIEGYDERTTAMKGMLATMIASLPAADRDLCPYCSLDTNPDLDHFLPKAVYPEFALYAKNLLPICTNCNRSKQNSVKTAGSGHRLFLYPPTEPSGNAPVLKAELNFSKGMTVTYSIEASGHPTQAEFDLVSRHFYRLKLDERYRKRANSHLASFKADIFGKSRQVVRKTLLAKISSAGSGEPINGWFPALYRTINGNRTDTLNWLLAP